MQPKGDICKLANAESGFSMLTGRFLAACLSVSHMSQEHGSILVCCAMSA